MKVLFTTYPTAFQFQGGGEVIIKKSKEVLEKQGIEVRLFNHWEDHIGDYDVLHNFGLAAESEVYVNFAKREGVPVAIHTIYWPSTGYALHGDFPLLARLRVMASELINRYGLVGMSAKRRMLSKADILFPNSITETDMLNRNFSIAKNKMHVVHDGVDKRFFSAKKRLFADRYGIEDFVLYVGRIEPRKNVLGLVRALKGTGMPLVVVGEASAQHAAYWELCRKEADSNVWFIGRLEHESDMLASAYAAARVFALPSWFETPGIAAMEAAAAGANIVITKRGCTQEYFRGFANYVEPTDAAMIKGAVIDSFEAKKTKKLSRHIAKNYAWERVAEEIIAGYRKIVK